MSMGNTEGGDRLIAGRYRLLSRLGRGGMGTVWRAEDTLLNREVAVKEVHLRRESSAGEREQQRERTLREARAVAQVRHPSVVGIHDVVEQDGEPWIVMELVDGDSLGARLAAGGPMPPREAAAIGLAVLSALQAAHERGVLHRDVKPDNVLLERGSDRVVLTDFGIARMDGSTTLTEAGAFIGSPEFTAPERTEGRAAGPESDLWSVGVLLCAVLEGRSPFRRDSVSGVLYAVLYEEIVLPASAEPLAGVVRGLLERDPARRLTAVEASRRLTDYLENRGQDSVSPAADTHTSVRTPTVVPGRTLREEHGADRASAPVPAREPVREPERAATPEAAPARGGHSRGKAVLLGAVVVVVAGALAAGGVLLFGPRTGTTTAAPPGRTSSAAPATPSASVTPSAAASASAEPTPTATPTASASATRPSAVAPAGYTLRDDEAGFSLAVPDGWPRSTLDGGLVFYISPDKRFRIGVHPDEAVAPKGVLSTLRGQDLAGPKTYPGYHGNTVEPTVFHGTDDAALMQWTWNGYPDEDFGPRRVQDQSWTEGGKTYDFWVSAPTDSLDQADRYFQIVESTFAVTP